MIDRRFNWLALLGELKTTRREVLEDTVERIVRIYDCHKENEAQMVEDIEDVLEELRRDLL